VNNLPTVATRQCTSRELNLRPIDRESNAIPTMLPSHPVKYHAINVINSNSDLYFRATIYFYEKREEITVNMDRSEFVNRPKTHRLGLRYVWLFDKLVNGRVANKSHVTSTARHALERSGKTTERIITRTPSLQSLTGTFLTHARWIVTCVTYITTSYWHPGIQH